MKDLMENFKMFTEGEVIDFQKHRMAKAIEEFRNIFSVKPYEDEVEELIQHLETKSLEGALRAQGFSPETMGMDQLGMIHMWADKWFRKKSLI